MFTVLLVSGPGRATDHAGDISADETWYFDDNPHVIVDHVTVEAAAILRLEPGVEVRVDDGRRLDVHGELRAVGGPDREILFTQNSADRWHSLHFEDDGFGTLEHCVIQLATYGIHAGSSGIVTTANVTIQGCAYGIYGDTGTITLRHDRIVNNDDYGIYLLDADLVFGTNPTEWNDIHGNGAGRPSRDLHLQDHPDDVEARWVHWGVMEHETILGRIWDVHDAWGLGYVHILPFVNAAHDMATTAVEDGLPGGVPPPFALRQNAPNPFNPSTVIGYDLPARAAVRLEIFDLSGTRVALLVDEVRPAGRHETVWRGVDDRGRALASGAYAYRIAAGRDVETRRMMLVR